MIWDLANTQYNINTIAHKHVWMRHDFFELKYIKATKTLCGAMYTRYKMVLVECLEMTCVCMQNVGVIGISAKCLSSQNHG